MKDIAREALDSALGRGVTYADVRVVESKERALTTKNGKPGHIASSESMGLGIRVIVDGCWGFAATDDLAKPSIQ
jgi:TldD protein